MSNRASHPCRRVCGERHSQYASDGFFHLTTFKPFENKFHHRHPRQCAGNVAGGARPYTACEKISSRRRNDYVIHTHGDKVLDAPLAQIGGKGVFTKELEHALLAGEIDFAVHSLKDLPTDLPPGLTIGAIPMRKDVRDVFIARKGTRKKFESLPDGATIATSSLRRKAQLLHLRPDLAIVDVRGNLNTRLKKLDDSAWDGMILAYAGVKRLGWEKRITDIFTIDTVVPAVGQAAWESKFVKTITIRRSCRKTASSCNRLLRARRAALLRTLEGGCQVPIGAHARLTRAPRTPLSLAAVVASLNGETLVRGTMRGSPKNPDALGERLAKKLYAHGAKEILASIR